jgi:hypothetical protein
MYQGPKSRFNNLSTSRGPLARMHTNSTESPLPGLEIVSHALQFYFFFLYREHSS